MPNLQHFLRTDKHLKNSSTLQVVTGKNSASFYIVKQQKVKKKLKKKLTNKRPYKKFKNNKTKESHASV